MPAKVGRKNTLPEVGMIRVDAPRIGDTQRGQSGGWRTDRRPVSGPRIQQGTASEEILFKQAQNEPPELINTFKLTRYRVKLQENCCWIRVYWRKLLSCSRVFDRVLTKINRKNKITEFKCQSKFL